MRNGFTIIELLIALAILATLMAVTIPAFYRSHLKHRVMDGAVADVMESIQICKRLAIQTATPHFYEFSQGSNRQFVYPADHCESRQVRTTSNGVRLEVSDRSPDAQGKNRILFREDGSTENFSMRILYADQIQTVQVERHLGVPRVVRSR